MAIKIFKLHSGLYVSIGRTGPDGSMRAYKELTAEAWERTKFKTLSKRKRQRWGREKNMKNTLMTFGFVNV